VVKTAKEKSMSESEHLETNQEASNPPVMINSEELPKVVKAIIRNFIAGLMNSEELLTHVSEQIANNLVKGSKQPEPELASEKGKIIY
jgi:hypothetical protein